MFLPFISRPMLVAKLSLLIVCLHIASTHNNSGALLHARSVSLVSSLSSGQPFERSATFKWVNKRDGSALGYQNDEDQYDSDDREDPALKIHATRMSTRTLKPQKYLVQPGEKPAQEPRESAPANASSEEQAFDGPFDNEPSKSGSSSPSASRGLESVPTGDESGAQNSEQQQKQEQPSAHIESPNTGSDSGQNVASGDGSQAESTASTDAEDNKELPKPNSSGSDVGLQEPAGQLQSGLLSAAPPPESPEGSESRANAPSQEEQHQQQQQVPSQAGNTEDGAQTNEAENGAVDGGPEAELTQEQGSPANATQESNSATGHQEVVDSKAPELQTTSEPAQPASGQEEKLSPEAATANTSPGADSSGQPEAPPAPEAVPDVPAVPAEPAPPLMVESPQTNEGQPSAEVNHAVEANAPEDKPDSGASGDKTGVEQVPVPKPGADITSQATRENQEQEKPQEEPEQSAQPAEPHHQEHPGEPEQAPGNDAGPQNYSAQGHDVRPNSEQSGSAGAPESEPSHQEQSATGQAHGESNSSARDSDENLPPPPPPLGSSEQNSATPGHGQSSGGQSGATQTAAAAGAGAAAAVLAGPKVDSNQIGNEGASNEEETSKTGGGGADQASQQQPASPPYQLAKNESNIVSPVSKPQEAQEYVDGEDKFEYKFKWDTCSHLTQAAHLSESVLNKTVELILARLSSDECLLKSRSKLSPVLNKRISGFVMEVSSMPVDLNQMAYGQMTRVSCVSDKEANSLSPSEGSSKQQLKFRLRLDHDLPDQVMSSRWRLYQALHLDEPPMEMFRSPSSTATNELGGRYKKSLIGGARRGSHRTANQCQKFKLESGVFQLELLSLKTSSIYEIQLDSSGQHEQPAIGSVQLVDFKVGQLYLDHGLKMANNNNNWDGSGDNTAKGSANINHLKRLGQLQQQTRQILHSHNNHFRRNNWLLDLYANWLKHEYRQQLAHLITGGGQLVDQLNACFAHEPAEQATGSAGNKTGASE